MNVNEALTHLRTYCEEQDFSGWDPYDALNCPFMPVLSMGTKYGRIAWTQLLRRLPFNLRPLLRIPKGHNPKGIGLFLEGYAKIFAVTGDEVCREKIDYLLELLKKYRASAYNGGWGYNFDWQNRVMFVPKHTPTIVNSAFIGHALLDAYELVGTQEALDMAKEIKGFYMNGPNRQQVGDTFCFSYTPLDQNFVHNANMLSASFLMRLGYKTDDEELKGLSRSSMAYSMAYQRDDGSWFYAEPESQRWVDSYHTGFNLEALRWFIRLGEGDLYQEAYNKGVKFYAQNFFLSDGTPKHYHDRVNPLDIHSPAEAISFFSGEAGYHELVDRILAWTFRNLWDVQRGYFYFRKNRGYTNKQPYMRWVEAWGFRALTEYVYQTAKTEPDAF